MAQQPPLTPEQLKAPPLSGEAYLKRLRDDKKKKYPQLPPIYRAMQDGSLEREYLDAWIKDLYAYWDNLHLAAGGAFIKTNLEAVRSRALVKLVSVEGKELGRQWN